MSGKIIGVAKEVADATKKLSTAGRGVALGLSKNKGKTIKVEVLQKRIREKAKEAGLTVKNYRMQNPTDSDVKALYAAKPTIKEADSIRKTNRASDAANKERNKLETRFEKEAKDEFKKQGKVMKKDYFQEDLDKIVNKKMQEYKLNLKSGGLSTKKYMNPVKIVDNRKRK